MSEKEIYQEIGKRVRKARKDKKLTQEDVCEQIQLSISSISNMEVGRHRIQIHILYQLAEIFEVGIEDLIVHSKSKLPLS